MIAIAYRILGIIAGALLLAGCNGGGGSAVAANLSIGGTLAGLDGGAQVQLLDNGRDALTVKAAGPFVFATPVAQGGSYAVTVGVQPTAQTCLVSNGSGAGVTTDIVNVQIECSTDSYTIGGRVSGLDSGRQVTLLDNAGNALIIAGNTSFTFSVPIPYNGNYTVSVASQPTGQTCVVGNGSGIGVTANIVNVQIVCTSKPVVHIINCWGDSLTAGAGSSAPANAYPARLAALLQRSTSNYGIGGQTSTQIAMRQGGDPTVLTFSGNVIDGGGVANYVTAINGVAIRGTATYQAPDYRLLSTAATNFPISMPGTVGSVHGILTRTATGGVNGGQSTTESYSFAQDSGDTRIAIPDSGAAFVPDIALSVPEVTIIWVGRNNVLYTSQVLADIANLVAAARERGYLVLGIPNAQGEELGTSNYSSIVQLNQTLANSYGKNFVDIRSALVAAYDATSPQDVLDHANDIPPASLRTDAIHLNDAGYLLVARKVAQAIAANGY